MNVPSTLEVLCLTDHSNLSSDCLVGIDELINLKELHLDASAFFIDQLLIYPDREENKNDKNNIPIANLPNLKIVSFVFGIIIFKEDFLDNWIELLKADFLFSIINQRISSITFEYDMVYQIIVTLK